MSAADPAVPDFVREHAERYRRAEPEPSPQVTDEAAAAAVDSGLALGVGLPNVPWTIGQADRIYNVLLAGGQGSGKSSLLLRLAMNDILASNTATVVLDMKGSLSERLLRLIPPDIPKRWWDEDAGRFVTGTKRVWYLDLRQPAFGLTPLRVEPGWTHNSLADEFARIADAITRALLDLYPGQIMGSSEDLIERAVVGTMAIAWWEHEQRCRAEGRPPTRDGFNGSFEVLSQMFAPSDRLDDRPSADRGGRGSRPNRWHQAAGRACQKLPNLDQVADTMLYEIPRQARDNLTDIAKRMEAPANKLRPLVGAAASVRRFVGHPERLSLPSMIQANDILIVNPRIELIGEDQASILTNFIVHMLDLQLKRQIGLPRSRRPRVSLIIDEAHRLITDTLMTMTATHREAGLTVAAAIQYVSQLGADASTPARREKILKGVGNLLQSKVLFRMSDSDDADSHSQIFRSVYETTIRADPSSRVRMPFDPARLQTLRDHHALVSLVSSGGHVRDELLGAGPGATRLPAFVSRTYRMPEVDEIPDGWRQEHLARQQRIFTSYPDDMSTLALADVPSGLGGQAAPPPVREIGLAAVPPPAERVEEIEPAEHVEPAARVESIETVESIEPPTAPPAPPSPEPAAAREQIGGVRIERAQPAAPRTTPRTIKSPCLEVLCRPTDEPMPIDGRPPESLAVREALSEAATFEAATSLEAWIVAGDDVRAEARRMSARAHEQACADAEAAGLSGDQGERSAQQAAQRAAAKVLAPHVDAPWRTPTGELSLGDADAHTLEVIARLLVGAPRQLGVLLEGKPSQRALRERLGRLFDAGLLARSEAIIDGRRGRRPRLYAVAPRGLEYLRRRHEEIGDGSLPGYLLEGRTLPTPLGRDTVHRELSMQLLLVALVEHGDRTTNVHWHTTRMPGGRWDVGMIHRSRRDHELRLGDVLPAPGLRAHGERLDVASVLEPDLSLSLDGPANGRKATADLLVEIDCAGRRRPAAADRLAAYDHFLGGWCLRTRRFAEDARGRPLALFVSTTSERMLKLIAAADEEMTLGFAAQGQYEPSEFAYPGRAHVAFTCLDWLLGGSATALRLPPLPPDARGDGAPMRPETTALLPPAWWTAR